MNFVDEFMELIKKVEEKEAIMEEEAGRWLMRAFEKQSEKDRLNATQER